MIVLNGVAFHAAHEQLEARLPTFRMIYGHEVRLVRQPLQEAVNRVHQNGMAQSVCIAAIGNLQTTELVQQRLQIFLK